jgi:hypothetical protein
MNSLGKLLSFLNRLEQAKICYILKHVRDETIMVLIAVPGERWEVEFFEDGSIEVEKFISTAVIGNGDMMRLLRNTSQNLPKTGPDYTGQMA